MQPVNQVSNLIEPTFDKPNKEPINNPEVKHIVSSSSDRPNRKPLSDRNSVTTIKCLPEEVENQVATTLQPHAESGEFLKTSSESMVFEPGLSVADELIIGFDAESEGIVKKIVTKMEAENSIDIPLPDGWIKKSMETGDFSVSWYIFDNNGMPRIECYNLTSTLKYALAGKPERTLGFNIFSFDCSVSVKDELELEELTVQSEDAVREGLKELLGCQVFENVNEVLNILMMPNLYMDHGKKLTRHIKPFIDWSNETGNIQRLYQFLEGKDKNIDIVVKISAIVEIFIVNKDLPLIISICEKTTVCKNAKTNAKSNEFVFMKWKYLHSVNASEDRITSECKNSGCIEDHLCSCAGSPKANKGSYKEE